MRRAGKKRTANSAFPSGAPAMACPYGPGMALTPGMSGAPASLAMGSMTANFLGLPPIPPMIPIAGATEEAAKKAETAGTSVLGQIAACTTARKVLEFLAPRIEAVGAGVLIEGLFEINKKTNSVKARQNVLETSAGRRLCERIRNALKSAPIVPEQTAVAGGPGLAVTQAAKGCFALAKAEVHDQASLEGAVRTCTRTRVQNWPARAMAYLLSGLAMGGQILQHRDLVSACVKEVLGGRLRELDADAMAELLSAVIAARKHKDGATETVRRQPDDEKLFEAVAESSAKLMNSLEPRQLAEMVHCYAQFGIKRKDLFEAAAPKILAAQNKLSDRHMQQCIQAYSRFGIPLREKAKGKLNVQVITGDFIRPSDPPPRSANMQRGCQDGGEHAIPFSKALTDATQVKTYD